MQFLRNKKLLLTLAVVAGIAIVAFFFARARGTRPAPSPTAGASYKALTPGVSREQDIKNTLGVPVKETTGDNQTLLEYTSKNPNFNDEFSLKSGTLTFIKQIVTLEDNLKIADVEKKYGRYENVLYGNLSTSGFNLYVYPDKGVAYIGQPESGFITEIWYFAPTDLNTFKQLFAPGYSETLVPRQ